MTEEKISEPRPVEATDVDHQSHTADAAETHAAETDAAETHAAETDAIETDAIETDAIETDAAPEPKLVRRVVCSYKLGWLPGDWLQTWRRLDRVFARANLRVKATLAPLEDLPSDTDILVVPPDLRDAANAAVTPGTPILVTPASAAAAAFADLVTRLQAGTDFTAEKIDPDIEKTKPKIVSYRGSTIID